MTRGSDGPCHLTQPQTQWTLALPLQTTYPDGTTAFKWAATGHRLVYDVVKVDEAGREFPVEGAKAYTVAEFVALKGRKSMMSMDEATVLPPGEEEGEEGPLSLRDYLARYGVEV